MSESDGLSSLELLGYVYTYLGVHLFEIEQEPGYPPLPVHVWQASIKVNRQQSVHGILNG